MRVQDPNAVVYGIAAMTVTTEIMINYIQAKKYFKLYLKNQKLASVFDSDPTSTFRNRYT